MITIVRTDSGDPEFVELVRHLDSELAVRDGDEHSYYSQFNKIDSLQHVVVAYSDGIAVGCGAIKPFADRVAEIKRMFVMPEKRGNRIAGEILRELEVWARELDFDTCVLETGYKQPEAIALYKRAGYEVTPNYGQYIGMDNSVCMRKNIR